MVRAQKRFLAAPCICRRERKMVGEGCSKPEENCLVFGRGVDYYLTNGLGREITREEALEILRKADDAGLVLQPSNAKQIANICCCCGCCCGVLRTVKEYPKPAEIIASAFTAEADSELCSGCGTCIERCQMDALKRVDDRIILDKDRCIGCGLCISTCPTGALELKKKPDDQQPEVPRNLIENYRKLGRVRGKLGPAKEAKILVKTAVNRVLARRG
jgi:ferredoxin